jgi:quercetin dioxygenase-like cupin family protein
VVFLLLTAISQASIWVTSVPSTIRPYAIAHYVPNGYVVGQQIFRFPVIGASSGNAFTLIQTNAPGSAYLGVLPHFHQVHYESFFNYKGRFQVWAQKDGNEQARIFTTGDFGAVPPNTNHTFQFMDPDSEMVGVISPGGFEYVTAPFKSVTH